MKSALKKVSLILAICFVAFHLYTAAFGTMPGIAQKSIHLGFLLVIFYINAMVDSEKRWEQIFLGIMALFALGGGVLVLVAGVALWRYHRVAVKQFGGITGDLAGWFLQKCEIWMLAALAVSQWGGVL